MNTFRSCVLTLVAGSLCNFACAAPPPVSAFTDYPRYESMKISPNGGFLALTQRTAEHEMMTVLRYPDLSVSTYTTFGKWMDIDRFEWANESRLLIQPARRFMGYTSFHAPTGEIIGLDVDGKKSDLLFGFHRGIWQEARIPPSSAQLIDLLPDDPDEVLIQTRAFNAAGTGNSVQRMHVKTGRLAKVAGSPVQRAFYVTDSKHQLVLVFGLNEKGDTQTYRFVPSNRSWQLLTTNADEEGFLLPLQDTAQPDEFIALDSVSTPTASVVMWNSVSNERRVLFSSEISDVRPQGVDSDGRVWLYAYDDHVPEYWYPDPEHPLAKAHRMLSSRFKDANISFTSETRDMSLAVARVSAPRIPPVFYLIDVKNQNVVQQLPAYPDLKPEELSPTDPIELTVRDGTKLRGYLTTPNGRDMKDLPMIVLVHGGPHGPFDRYDFDYEAQLFASRGYAVLQVNYRGSGGRGRIFEALGYGRWGLEMQDDISDAVTWAINSGVADRHRICIYGASYGAYAALTGTFREPEMFKCAIGVAGVYDLPLMFKKGDVQTYERGVRFLKKAIGTDMDELRKRSPVYNADRIQAAVMLVHGSIDQRAPLAHAVRMRAALKKAGNPPQWISETGEGHGIFNEKTRAKTYEQILAFLAKHLGSSLPAESIDPSRK